MCFGLFSVSLQCFIMAKWKRKETFVLALVAILISQQDRHASAQMFGSGTIHEALLNYMQQMSQAPTTQAPPRVQATNPPPHLPVTQAPSTQPLPVYVPRAPPPTQPPVPSQLAPYQPQFQPAQYVPVQTTPVPAVPYQPRATLPVYSDIYLPVVTQPPPQTTPKAPPKPGSIPFVPQEWYAATPRPTYPPTPTPPPFDPWQAPSFAPAPAKVQPLDLAKTYIPPQFLQTAMNVGRQMGVTGYFESFGCVDPTTHMPRGTTTQGLVLGCASPQSQNLCRMAGQQAMGEAAGGDNMMQMMAMFQPPQFKQRMEKCLSPTIMNKIMMQQISGGGSAASNPLMTMMMLGGGGGGGGATPLMSMMMMNMMNRHLNSNSQSSSSLRPQVYRNSQWGGSFGSNSNSNALGSPSFPAGAAQPAGSQTHGQSSISSIYSALFGGQQTQASPRVKRQAKLISKSSRSKRQAAGNWFTSSMGGNVQPFRESPGLPIGAAQPVPQTHNQAGGLFSSLLGMGPGGQSSSGSMFGLNSANSSGSSPSPEGYSSYFNSMLASNSAGNTGHSLPAGAATLTGQQSNTQGQSTEVQDVLQECMAFLPIMMSGAEGGFGSPEAAEHIMNVRKSMLPYECTEAGILPFRMCCPGQVGRPTMMDLVMSSGSQGA